MTRKSIINTSHLWLDQVPRHERPQPRQHPHDARLARPIGARDQRPLALPHRERQLARQDIAGRGNHGHVAEADGGAGGGGGGGDGEGGGGALGAGERKWVGGLLWYCIVYRYLTVFITRVSRSPTATRSAAPESC